MLSGASLRASLLLFSTWALGQADKEFHDPPIHYRAKFRYWLPDASVSPNNVNQDIRDAKAVGAGGLEYLPFYLYGFPPQQAPGRDPPTDWTKYGFGTPAYNELFKSSLATAQETGILLDYALGANQGQGVPSEILTPGLAVQLLQGNTTLTPGGSFSAPVPQAHQPSSSITSGLTFMHPLEQFGTPKLVSVIAYQVLNDVKNTTTGTSVIQLNQSSFIDLTSEVEGWSLQWTPPDITKTWKIFSFWEAYTNQRSCSGGINATDFVGNGSWTVDHFSALGASRVTEFWDKYILSDAELASLLKSVGQYAWEDSMEILASLYWTPGFLSKFQATLGYDLQPYLPLLFSPSNTWNGALPVYNETYSFDGSDPTSNAHQLDYRKVLNDGYQEYIEHFENWTHSIGNQYSNQPAYNLPLQMLSDIPLDDAPEGESLGFNQIYDAYRQFAGPAHLANKSIISSELGAVFQPAHSLHVPELLQMLKRSWAGGFTQHVLHGFPTTGPYPNTTWPGYNTFYYSVTEMWNSVQPAWQHLRDALDYVGRNQYILQQGTPRVDLAFYLFESPWTPAAVYASTNLEELGFTYDYVGPDNLASSLSVSSNTLGIPAYKALIINNQTVATAAAVEALVRFTSAGLPIVLVGSAPNESYPTTTSEASALSSATTSLLSQKNVHKAASVDDLPAVLSSLGISPRVAIDASSRPVRSVLRTTPSVDYVYFFNDQNQSTQGTASLEISSSVTPYIYDAWTGTKTPLSNYTLTNSTLSTQFNLQSNETFILALHQGSASNSSTRARAFIPSRSVTNLSTWDLVIEDWHSAPDRFTVITDVTNHTYNSTTLKPWNQLDTALTNVSGVGHYTTTFTAPSSTNSSSLAAKLSLPLIQHTARVYLDGVWLGPIDPVNPVLLLNGVESGCRHELRVDMTTTLYNRIKSEANETLIIGFSAAELEAGYATVPYEGYGLVGDVSLTWGSIGR